MTQSEKNPARVTVRATLSYVSVFEPYVDPKKPTDKGKYKCLLLIDKEDKASVKAMQGAIKYVEAQMIKEKYAGKAPKKAIPNTLGDGDEDKEGEEYENRMYINVWKNRQPVIVDRKRNPITDEEEIYSGVIANVAIEFYYYWREDSKGITASLEAIQKVADGEPLGAARVRAEDVFDEIEEDDEDIDELD